MEVASWAKTGNPTAKPIAKKNETRRIDILGIIKTELTDKSTPAGKLTRHARQFAGWVVVRPSTILSNSDAKLNGYLNSKIFMS